MTTTVSGSLIKFAALASLLILIYTGISAGDKPHLADGSYAGYHPRSFAAGDALTLSANAAALHSDLSLSTPLF